MSVSEALCEFGAVVTAVMLVRALNDRIDDDGQLVLSTGDVDDISLVVCELDDVLGCAE